MACSNPLLEKRKASPALPPDSSRLMFGLVSSKIQSAYCITAHGQGGRYVTRADVDLQRQTKRHDEREVMPIEALLE